MQSYPCSDKTFGEALEEINTAWEQFREVIAEVLAPAFEQIVETLAAFYEACQRVELTHRLSQWLPGGTAVWLAERWPKKLLPTPRFDEWESTE